MIPGDSPFRFGQAGELQRIITEATDDEYHWMLHGADQVHLGWMPFQIADFCAIMTECLAEVNGVQFLEVGSGIGTKSQIARYMFGFTTLGIERDRQMIAQALRKGRGPVVHADALDYGSYDVPDLIWMYRPFRDRDKERELEQKIYAEMKPGAIFAGGQLETFPEAGFVPVIDDREIRRGAWQKNG